MHKQQSLVASLLAVWFEPAETIAPTADAASPTGESTPGFASSSVMLGAGGSGSFSQRQLLTSARTKR